MIVFFVLELQKQNSPDKNEYQRIELDIPKKVHKLQNLIHIKSFFLYLQDMLIQKVQEII